MLYNIAYSVFTVWTSQRIGLCRTDVSLRYVVVQSTRLHDFVLISFQARSTVSKKKKRENTLVINLTVLISENVRSCLTTWKSWHSKTSQYIVVDKQMLWKSSIEDWNYYCYWQKKRIYFWRLLKRLQNDFIWYKRAYRHFRLRTDVIRKIMPLRLESSFWLRPFAFQWKREFPHELNTFGVHNDRKG